MLIVYLFVSWIAMCAGGKVLVVFPVPGKSHGILGESVARILLSAGHEVTFVSPFPPDIRSTNLNYVELNSVKNQKRTKVSNLYQSPHSVTHAQEVGPMFARMMLEDPEVKALLHDPGVNFDAVLVEWFYTGLLAPYINKQVEIPAYEELYQEPLRIRGKPMPELESVVYNASLMFSNSHPPLGQRLPLPLNVKYIGGHHIELSPPPLPKKLKDIMDKSKKGVIYFSMGSLLKGKDLPEDMKRSLIDMFAQLDETIIWKMEEKIEDLPKNVHILEWAPQQSILNHPNTVVFITHGGLVSILEATHFGVPVIGVPIFADQFFNVDLAVHRGVGIRVNLGENFTLKLQTAIDYIIGNISYHENAKAASFTFRNRPALPQSELKHWLQLVMDTKGAMHLRSPALQVSLPERLYLDVLFLLILILWFLSKVLKVIKVHVKTSDDEWEKKNS